MTSMSAMIRIVGHVDNVYEDGDKVRVEFDEQVPPFPEAGDDVDEWAEDNLFPLTGTGRPDGDAGYFLKITRCDEQPDLVGREFEWGT